MESERKRLKSVKEMKIAFKVKEQLIRNALKSVDIKTGSNKKIVFDDDIDDIVIDNEAKKTKRKPLFQDDADEEDLNADEIDFKIDSGVNEKLLKLQTNHGNDKRFALDERFIDDEDVAEGEGGDRGIESNVDEEKKWQLGILQDVLGRPIRIKNDASSSVKRKNQMVRYDPTQTDHREYEVSPEKQAVKKSKRKRQTESASKVEEQIAEPVSKELYYDVSDTLVDSLKQESSFSLLKAFGKETVDTNNSATKRPYEENRKLEIDTSAARNPFKYDSSDNEDDTDNACENDVNNKDSVEDRNSFNWREKFFFAVNDPRFQDAEKFFVKAPVREEDFKNTRRELKQIVRSKVRNNLRKSLPWNKRKIKKK